MLHDEGEEVTGIFGFEIAGRYSDIEGIDNFGHSVGVTVEVNEYFFLDLCYEAGYSLVSEYRLVHLPDIVQHKLHEHWLEVPPC